MLVFSWLNSYMFVYSRISPYMFLHDCVLKAGAPTKMYHDDI